LNPRIKESLNVKRRSHGTKDLSYQTKIISHETCRKANDFRLTCQAVAVSQARSRTQAQVGCGDKSRGAPERQLFPLLAAFGKLTNPNHGGLVPRAGGSEISSYAGQLQIFPLVFSRLRQSAAAIPSLCSPGNGGERSEAHLAGGAHEATPPANDACYSNVQLPPSRLPWARNVFP
jgi:hypothetical protein